MTTSDAELELKTSRKDLEEALGENRTLYFNKLKQWFKVKVTKEEFDEEARKLLTPEQVHLHNRFLLAILNKCYMPPTAPQESPKIIRQERTSKSKASHHDKTKKSKIKKKSRPKTNRAPFQPANILDHVPACEPLPPTDFDPERLRFCTREAFLPNRSMILGRMLVGAWENSLEGADEAAAEILVIAVQQFLKNVLMAIFERRSGYKIREKCFRYGVGSSVPNPWLRNTSQLFDDSQKCVATEITDDPDAPQLPSLKPNLELAEQSAAFAVACADYKTSSKPRQPVTLYDVLDALQIRKDVVPGQSVYSVGMFRLFCNVWHPSHQDLENQSRPNVT